jgi:hypothetical protein
MAPLAAARPPGRPAAAVRMARAARLEPAAGEWERLPPRVVRLEPDAARERVARAVLHAVPARLAVAQVEQPVAVRQRPAAQPGQARAVALERAALVVAAQAVRPGQAASVEAARAVPLVEAVPAVRREPGASAVQREEAAQRQEAAQAQREARQALREARQALREALRAFSPRQAGAREAELAPR